MGTLLLAGLWFSIFPFPEKIRSRTKKFTKTNFYNSDEVGRVLPKKKKKKKKKTGAGSRLQFATRKNLSKNPKLRTKLHRKHKILALLPPPLSLSLSLDIIVKTETGQRAGSPLEFLSIIRSFRFLSALFSPSIPSFYSSFFWQAALRAGYFVFETASNNQFLILSSSSHNLSIERDLSNLWNSIAKQPGKFPHCPRQRTRACVVIQFAFHGIIETKFTNRKN